MLLMRGATQHYWQHQLPKTRKPTNPRINLTFRVICQPAKARAGRNREAGSVA
jgi:hypothetical protein